jgi:hypothetical protein
MKPVKIFLLLAIAYSNLLSAQQVSKLIAASRWTYTNTPGFIPFDSVTYIHSGSRNTIPFLSGNWNYIDYDKQGYDTMVWYKYNTANTYDYQWRMLRTYDASDSVTEYQEQKYLNGWVNNDRNMWVYKPNHTRDTFSYQLYDISSNTYVDNEKTTYTYDTNGHLVLALTKEWLSSGSIWRNIVLDSIWYDSVTGQLAKRMFGDWDWINGGFFREHYRNKYVYDVNGRVACDSQWANTNKDRITYHVYDANGKLLKDSFYSWTTPLTYGGKTDYTYDANNNLIKMEQFNWDNVNMVYKNHYREFYNYNTYNQVTRITNETFYNNVWWNPYNSYVKYYYYGTVNHVADLDNTNDKVKIYPVPAVSYINLELNFSATHDFTVSISDMQGRLLKQWKEPAQKKYTKQVMLQDMPAGSYILQVVSAKENLTRNFSVVR